MDSVVHGLSHESSRSTETAHAHARLPPDRCAEVGRIRAEAPDAKLVAVLRDPVDRAHSNWFENGLRRPFDHWRDLDNGSTRRTLDINGRFGTGFTSIDRPGAVEG